MNAEQATNFRSKLANKGVFGPFMKTTDPAFVEIAGHAGMDFVILDMEHGPGSLSEMQNLIRGARLTGALPIIRIGKLCEHGILQALDIGAAGIQVPMVSTAKEAEAVVKYAKYHPEGGRGVCRFVRAANYSATPRERYFPSANKDTMVIIQLEGCNVFEELDEILKVKGIDIIFIGPYDLSQSLGVPGQTSHPKVVEAMKNIVDKAKKAGVVTGTFTDSPETLETWKSAGVQYLSYSVDVGIFYNACIDLVKKFSH